MAEEAENGQKTTAPALKDWIKQFKWPDKTFLEDAKKILVDRTSRIYLLALLMVGGMSGSSAMPANALKERTPAPGRSHAPWEPGKGGKGKPPAFAPTPSPPPDPTVTPTPQPVTRPEDVLETFCGLKVDKTQSGPDSALFPLVKQSVTLNEIGDPPDRGLAYGLTSPYYNPDGTTSSGYSFGITQEDIANNPNAFAVFRCIIEHANNIPKGEREGMLRDMGNNVGTLGSSENYRGQINVALSSAFGKMMVDALDNYQFQRNTDVVMQLIDAAKHNPHGAGVLDDSNYNDPSYKRTVAMLAMFVNEFGAGQGYDSADGGISDLMGCLSKGTLQGAGNHGPHLPVTEESIAGWIGSEGFYLANPDNYKVFLQKAHDAADAVSLPPLNAVPPEHHGRHMLTGFPASNKLAQTPFSAEDKQRMVQSMSDILPGSSITAVSEEQRREQSAKGLEATLKARRQALRQG